MGADAGTAPSVQPAEAADSGKKKRKRQHRSTGVSSSSHADQGLSAEASEVEKAELSKKKTKTSPESPKSPNRESMKRRDGGSKRNEELEEEEGAAKSDKAKKKSGGKASDPEPPAGPPNKKVWSEGDVISLLEGIIECQGKHGVDACSRFSLIHKHISETQHMEVTHTQLYEKMRRLKNNLNKAISAAAAAKKTTMTTKNKGGSHPAAFTKPHYQAVFELSKKIWTVKKPPVVPVTAVYNGGTHGFNKAPHWEEVEEEEEEEEVGGAGSGSSSPWYSAGLKGILSELEKEAMHYHVGVDLLKKGLELIQPSKVKTFEERWKANRAASAKLLLEISRLKKDLLRACLEALDSRCL